MNARSRSSRPVTPLIRVAVGADHGGFALKAKLLTVLQALGAEVADLGTHSSAPCDYPLIAFKVA